MTVGTWAWGHGHRGGDHCRDTSMGMGITLGTWAQGWVPQWGDGHEGTQAVWGQGTRNRLGRWASWMRWGWSIGDHPRDTGLGLGTALRRWE